MTDFHPLPAVPLEGPDLRLRPIEAEDLAAIRRWHNDPGLRDAQRGYPFPVSPPMEEAWLARAQRGDGRSATFAIQQRRDGALVGFTLLDQIDWPARTARFGITIGETAARGRGLGRKALGLMLGYGFLTLNLGRIWLEVVAFNARAIALYESAGFVREGCLRGHAFAAGAHHDVLMFGLMRDEWRRP